jgi:hypothetical protein
MSRRFCSDSIPHESWQWVQQSGAARHAQGAVDSIRCGGLHSLPYALIHTVLGLTSLSHGLRAGRHQSGRCDAAQESYAAVTVTVSCMLGWIVHVIW